MSDYNNTQLDERLFKANRDLELADEKVSDEVVIRNIQMENNYSSSDMIDISSTVEYGKTLESVTASLNDMDLGDSFNNNETMIVSDDVGSTRKSR